MVTFFKRTIGRLKLNAMLKQYADLYQLALSLIPALLGLAYPLFIDKINDISEKYRSRRLSKRFRREFFYYFFNVILIINIVELFLVPFLISANQQLELFLLTLQAISVFLVSMCMIIIYDLLMTYNDPVRLLDRIRMSVDPVQRMTDLAELIQFAASDEKQSDLFNMCMTELYTHTMDFQQRELVSSLHGSN